MSFVDFLLDFLPFVKTPPFLMKRDFIDQRTYSAVWNSYARNDWNGALETCQDCGFGKTSTNKILTYQGVMPKQNGPKNYVRVWSGFQIRVALGLLEMRSHLFMRDILLICLNCGFQTSSQETLRRYVHNEKKSRKRMAKWNPRRSLIFVKIQRVDFVNWFTSVNQFTNFIYIDEFGFDTDHSPNFGWSGIGQPAVYTLPPLTSRRLTYCIAVSPTAGLIHDEVELRAFTSNDFYYFLNTLITLPEAQIPQTILIMNNAPIHKESDVNEIMESSGCTTEYLPPHSPALNPADEVMANIKFNLSYELSHSYQQQSVNLTFATALGKVTPALVSNCDASMRDKFPAILVFSDI
jgi:transposase/ribosomal protein L37E